MASSMRNKQQGTRDRAPGKGREMREKGRERDSRPSVAKVTPDAPRASSIIYGVLPVLEALRADKRRVDKVLIADGAGERRLSEIIDLCRSRSIAWSRVPRDNFAKHLESGVNHQGVLAFSAAAGYVDVEDIIDASEIPLIVVLDGVEDPRNLGAILRVAECANEIGRASCRERV